MTGASQEWRRLAPRLATALLMAAALTAAILAFAEPMYLSLLAGTVAAGILIVYRIGRLVLAVVSLGAAAVTLITLLPGGDRAPNPQASPRPPDVTVPYRADIDISRSTATVSERITCDKECVARIVGALQGKPSLKSLRVDGWIGSAPVDGSPVLIREKTVRIPDAGHFGVDLASIPIAIGSASISITANGRRRSGVMRLVPGDGSVMSLDAPKGAIGASDPPTAETFDLPGGGHRERMSIRLTGTRDGIDLDVLGTALRNPAGRQIYAISGWGFLPWVLSAALLLLAAAAADYLKGLASKPLTRRRRLSPPPPPSGRAVGRARVPASRRSVP